MKKGLFLILIMSMLFTITSCQKEGNVEIVETPSAKYPNLLISNKTNEDNIYITSVQLVGYTFEPISIGNQESKNFQLNHGINGGYDNVKVVVHYKYGARSSWSDVKVNFKDGQTTKISLYKSSKGCFLSVFY